MKKMLITLTALLTVAMPGRTTDNTTGEIVYILSGLIIKNTNNTTSKAITR